MTDPAENAPARPDLEVAIGENCDALVALEAIQSMLGVEHRQAADLAQQAADALRRSIAELRSASRQPGSAAALGFVVGEAADAEPWERAAHGRAADPDTRDERRGDLDARDERRGDPDARGERRGRRDPIGAIRAGRTR